MPELLDFWWLSFVLLILWCLVGYVVWMFFRDRQNTAKKREKRYEDIRKALGLDDSVDSLEDLEKKYGSKDDSQSDS